MKRLLIWTSAMGLIIIMVSSLLLTGCGGNSPATSSSPAKPAPASTTSSAPAAAPASSTAPAPVASSAAPSSAPAPNTSAASQKTYELKFTDQYTPGQVDAQIDEMLGKMISDSTGGAVKVTYFHAETLGKSTDFLKMLNGGVADMANITPGNYGDQFALEMGLDMPMLGFTDRAGRLNAGWSLYDKGYIKGLADYKLISINPTPPMNLYVKKTVKSAADLKGLKIRASDANTRVWLTNLGATPVAMAGTDVYMSLDRGVLDGTYTAYDNFMQMKMNEVCKNAIWNPVGVAAMYIIMNKNTWNNLPADVQANIQKAIDAYKKAYIDARDDSAATDKLKGVSVNIINLTGDDQTALKSAAAPLKADWEKSMQDKGLKGKEMMDALDQILAKK